MNNPAVSSSKENISRGNITTPDVRLNPQSDNPSVYQIDRDVYEHLPKMYQKMAAVFAASGKIKIIDTRAGGSAYE